MAAFLQIAFLLGLEIQRRSLCT